MESIEGLKLQGKAPVVICSYLQSISALSTVATIYPPPSAGSCSYVPQVACAQPTKKPSLNIRNRWQRCRKRRAAIFFAPSPNHCSPFPSGYSDLQGILKVSILSPFPLFFSFSLTVLCKSTPKVLFLNSPGNLNKLLAAKFIGTFKELYTMTEWGLFLEWKQRMGQHMEIHWSSLTH